MATLSFELNRMTIDSRILCTDLQAVRGSLSAVDAYSAFTGILDTMLSQVCKSFEHVFVAFMYFSEVEKPSCVQPSCVSATCNDLQRNYHASIEIQWTSWTWIAKVKIKAVKKY